VQGCALTAGAGGAGAELRGVAGLSAVDPGDPKRLQPVPASPTATATASDESARRAGLALTSGTRRCAA
jgi:hypothetical protein